MNIFFKPKRNERHIVHFHRPFVEFVQSWTFRGNTKLLRRFACNCTVDGEERQLLIANLPKTIAVEVEKYAENKALKKNAVVVASVLLDLPPDRHPLETRYVVTGMDSYPSVTRFPWRLSSKIDSIREIKIGDSKRY